MVGEVKAPLRVVLLRDRDDMGAAIAESLKHVGCLTTEQSRHRIQPGQRFTRQDADVVFAYGPHNGSVLEAAKTIDRRDKSRPVFVWWLLENLPAYATPPWAVRVAAAGRLTVDKAIRAWSRKPIAANADRIRRILELGQRVRIWGEARHLYACGQLDAFYVDSAVATRILARDGVPNVHLPFGGHETFGRDLDLSRDVDVVFLGQPGSRRRLHYLEQTRRALLQRGITLRVIDGRQGYLDGEDRVRLLNRCKVVLNIMKEPEDSVGLRFLIAAANKALTVSEPSSALTLLKPGEHYIEAPVQDLAEAVESYVADRAARDRVVDRTYEFLRGEGHLSHMVRRIVTDCQAILARR